MKIRFFLVLIVLTSTAFGAANASSKYKKVTDLSAAVCTLTDDTTCQKLKVLPHNDMVKLNNVAAACFKELDADGCYANAKYLFNNGDQDLLLYWAQICAKGFAPACFYEKALSTNF